MEKKVEVLLVDLPGELLAVDEGGEEGGPLHHLLVAWAAGRIC